MRLALAQLNPTVGDLAANAEALGRAYERGVADGADVVCAGELALTGYPPDDLVLRPGFLAATRHALEELAERTGPAALVVGFVEDAGSVELVRDTIYSEQDDSRPLTNAAAVLRDGRIETVYRKGRIPNYGVFDEARYFHPVEGAAVVEVAGTRVGVTICEDMWGEDGPVAAAAQAGAQVVLNLNASPYEADKRAQREHWARHHARHEQVFVAYVNLVGGQDDVIFDGDSFVLDAQGHVLARCEAFTEELLVLDLDAPSEVLGTAERQLSSEAAIYSALVLATRDYADKNHFTTALVGLSGGIDSALTAVVAVDALGPDRVTCVAMPSPYSSEGSLTDARALVDALGCHWLEVGIEPMMEAFSDALAEPFDGTEEGIAEENVQSRTRCTLLMALSNKFGHLLLSTGNKSEYAVGYATLYGDMAGGFAVIKDVYKTVVYDLCTYRNAHWDESWRGPEAAVVPTEIIEKPPSAELRPDQRDTDSLPPYDVLDPLLMAYIEDVRSAESLVEEGFDKDLVEQVTRLVDRAEYKRRQAAPGPKVTRRAFGRDRRFPITNAWTGRPSR